MSVKTQFSPDDVKKVLKSNGLDDFDSILDYISKHSANPKDHPNISLGDGRDPDLWCCCICS